MELKKISSASFVFVLLGVLLQAWAQNGEISEELKNKNLDVLAQVRALNQKSLWSQSEEKINAQLSLITNEASDSTVGLLYFQKGIVLLQQKKWEQAEPALQKSLQARDSLKEYIFYYLALVNEGQNKYSEAEKYYKLVDGLNPNLKLKIETKKNLANLYLKKNQPQEALRILTSIEKRSRGTESYPEVLYHLSLAEIQKKSNANACRWLEKLYVKFPDYEKIKDWGVDPRQLQIEGKQISCQWTINELKERMRNLLWKGLEQKALLEIEDYKSKNKDTDKFQVEALLAQYYLQEGDVQKGYDILKSYFDLKKNDFDYLNSLAIAAARSGDYNTAVGSYYQAYLLSPRSESGKKALYQSAFLSYQFQDYDSATRKFQEFKKKYSNSGLTKDAEWHLAWLKYLKSEYSEAFKSFQQLQKSSRKMKSAQSDRLSYWMAMALYKQGKIEASKPYFEKLSKDPLLGYYSMASSERLKEIQSRIPPRGRWVMLEPPKRIDRFNTDIFLMPTDDFSSGTEADESEESIESTAANLETYKNKESLTNNKDEDKKENGDVSPVIVADGRESSDEEENQVTDFKNPLLTTKFQKARDLRILGLEDWSRWDLYEIEKKTRNKEYLRSLMSEYSSLKNFHRSSYIAQTYFSQMRAQQGIEGIKFMWQEAFPRAYSEDVSASSKKFEVPESLIWGIMKAESQYRVDAISPVGALGLMQVMPSTAHKIAQIIGYKNFSAEQLLKPTGAIQIGTAYLQRLMKKFNHNSALVAAAYNAGPHRVYSWLNSFGQLQMDEFIEHIPFLETRNYVKKVLMHQQIYSKIYGISDNLHVKLNETIKVNMPDRIPARETWDEI